EQTKTATLKQQIIIQFHEALRESQDDKAIGTGYERSARWRAPACGAQSREIEGTIVDPLPSGNAANAAVAALSLVKKAAARHKKIFTQAKVPLLDEVIDGRVTILRPLKLGDFGFVFTDKGLLIGQGMSRGFRQLSIMTTNTS
ncbi:hypothetical protein L208DRAFT_1251519, partial [Tricholoma matsutake]